MISQSSETKKYPLILGGITVIMGIGYVFHKNYF